MEKLKYLKGLKTKLINKKCNSIEQFEEVQEKLNEIELKIYNLRKEGK